MNFCECGIKTQTYKINREPPEWLSFCFRTVLPSSSFSCCPFDWVTEIKKEKRIEVYNLLNRLRYLCKRLKFIFQNRQNKTKTWDWNIYIPFVVPTWLLALIYFMAINHSKECALRLFHADPINQTNTSYLICYMCVCRSGQEKSKLQIKYAWKK